MGEGENSMNILRREFIYIWYYFSVQLEQILGYWVLGMVLGSAISVFGKKKIHAAFSRLGESRLGVLGLIPASILGIASPQCMYGTIPLAASFSQKGMRDDLLAAFMMSSILLNPQLLIYSAALGTAALTVRILSCFLCGIGAEHILAYGFFTKIKAISTSLVSRRRREGIQIRTFCWLRLSACRFMPAAAEQSRCFRSGWHPA